MAVMFPDYVHHECTSNAEKKLFDRFKNELPEKYTVLHSLGLSKHNYKLRAEIDFVVVSTRGIICVEVKGGRIKQEHGVWSFKDRYGQINTKRESPFDQASTAMFALRKAINSKFGHNSPQMSAVIGYSVFFTDQRFILESPEWDLRRLIDAGKIDKSLNCLIDEQFDYSAEEIQRVYGKLCIEMSSSQKNILIQYLRPDFDLIPSISTLIEKCHENLLRLTEEQYNLLEMISNNERTIISGGAGTGKTLLAVEKARRDSRKGEKVLMLCYNRLLADHIHSIFRHESLEYMPEVHTLHSFAHKIIVAAGLGGDLPEVLDQKFYMDTCPELFEKAFLDLYDSPPFDLLVVDEGQDLRFKNYLRMIDWLIEGGLSNGNWIWFEDIQQNIFLSQGDEETEFIMNRGHPARFRLTLNCRNTKPISIFTSLATASEWQNCMVDSTLKVTPTFYKSREHQFHLLEKIVKRLLGGGIIPFDIVILSPRVKKNSILSGQHKVGGISLVPYRDTENMHEKCIRYSTIQKFKGLESKVVIVTDLDDLVSPAARALNYVAFSRPTSCLEVLIFENVKEQYLQLAYEFGLRE